VLVTGAAGNIGSYFAEQAHQRYTLRLMVHSPAPELEAYGEVVQGDLADLERMKELCAGIDTVVHLAGNPDPNAVWADLVNPNIFGCYNIFVAAKAAACRRVIFASSIHAVSGYPPDVQVKTGEAVNPGDLYGVTKCFGEALGRYMAEHEGLSVIAIRIGAFQPRESALKGGIEMMDAFLSRRDMQQLLEKCIEVEDLQWALLHGLSDNRFKRLDLSDTKRLVGFEPHDDLTELSPELRDLRLAERVAANSLMDERQESGLREELAAAE
jgi:thioester reductase-like protein